ncbi:hypothetical protein L6278_02190 [Candidatus Parcubacteria bacterium]|nr:hypothetical protein [Candidatus Parcubacteria bacterium]
MKNLISWKFPEHTAPNRTKSWYIWATLFFLAMLLYAVLTANFLFGLIIIMLTIIMFILHNKEPLEIEFKITQDGIEIGNQNQTFKDLENFWIVYDPPHVKNLYFKFKATLKPTLIIPLLDQNPIKVREILKEYLLEDLDKESESTTETLARILKL